MLAILMLLACRISTKIVEVPIEVVKKEYIHEESNNKSKKIIYIKYLNIDTLRIDKINNNNLKIKNYGL